MAYLVPDPGEMRTVITITAPDLRGIDPDGYPVQGSVDLGPVHAKWTDSIGADADSRAEALHRRAATVEIRWVAGVTPECTLTRQGDPLPWTIVSVAEVAGWRRWLRLSVTQEVSR